MSAYLIRIDHKTYAGRNGSPFTLRDALAELRGVGNAALIDAVTGDVIVTNAGGTSDPDAETRLAMAAGRAAYESGRPAAPALDPIIRELLEDAQVGDPRNARLMRAFSAEYQRLADVDAAAILATA